MNTITTCNILFGTAYILLLCVINNNIDNRSVEIIS